LTSITAKEKLSHVIADWLGVLLEYDFEIYHRPGAEMVLEDSLSRMFLQMREYRAAEEANTTTCTPTKVVRRLRIDEFLSHMMVTSEEEEPRMRRRNMDALTKHPERQLRNFIKQRLDKETVSDPAEQMLMLARAHAQGHFGAETVYEKIWAKGYFWPGMLKQCKELAGSCNACLTWNTGHRGYNPVQSLKADQPWDHLAIDLAVDLPETEEGHKHILIVVDVLTRYVVAQPLKTKSMEEIADALYGVFTLLGPPKVIQSDNGAEFVNTLVEELMRVSKIDHRRVAPYNPRANGLAERMVQSVKQGLQKRLEGEFDKWNKVLRGVVYDINS
jgi:transposase InsO family protein